MRSCDARVLRTYPLGETSLIVVLLCREDELLRCVAKGGRSTGSKFRGYLEPGSALSCVVQLARREGGLHFLRDVSLRGRPPRHATTLESLALRLAPLELALRSSGEEVPAGLFDLLEETLALFDDGAQPGFAPFFGFEAALLDLHGLRPSLDNCGVCGDRLGSASICFLGGEGLFACHRCGVGGIELASRDCGGLLSVFQKRPGDLVELALDEKERRQIGRILHLALKRHLPCYRIPRSLEMLRPFRSDDKKEPAP